MQANGGGTPAAPNLLTGTPDEVALAIACWPDCPLDRLRLGMACRPVESLSRVPYLGFFAGWYKRGRSQDTARQALRMKVRKKDTSQGYTRPPEFLYC